MADRRLQVFHAVAKQRSFTKAAETLMMTQPAVTFQIKQLEDHFNTRLFDRGHGKINLTPAGELVLDYAERILGLSSEMDIRMLEMTGEVSGSLLIGASMTIAEFMLPRILGEFKSLYPQVQPHLVVANSESIETRVSEHLLDIGFIESPGHLPTLESQVCCDDELQVVCSPDFPLAKYKTVSPKQLLNLPYISREPGSGSREFTEAYLHNAGLSIDALNLVMEMGSPVSLNGVVETGLGFAIASRASIVKAHKLGILVAIPLKPKLIRTLTMVYPKEKFRSKLVVTFVEFASDRMKRFVAA
ncbi:MAG TPA: LysR family transcriptional regulator [Rhodocyclaceae bacterium]|jgi:DNA-binding transcriptional LysR family regulator|nr:LysR family transcriptional regulator [Rhodocyclaceae bacterium]